MFEKLLKLLDHCALSKSPRARKIAGSQGVNALLRDGCFAGEDARADRFDMLSQNRLPHGRGSVTQRIY